MFLLGNNLKINKQKNLKNLPDDVLIELKFSVVTSTIILVRQSNFTPLGENTPATTKRTFIGSRIYIIKSLSSKTKKGGKRGKINIKTLIL